MISQTIFKKGGHEWLIFGQDPEKPDNVADSNQVLISNGDRALLVDPGGIEVFPSMLSALTGKISIETIDRIFLSHQDPDVASSLPLWLRVCKDDIEVSVSSLWADVITHLDATCTVDAIPDEGGDLPVGGGLTLTVLPAHYLHSPGNFHIYDAEARMLYSGKVGSAIIPPSNWNGYIVQDFERHVEYMRAFHQRWMPSTDARDAWISQVSRLQLDAIVPQRGMVLRGDNVFRFLDWFSGLKLATGLSVMTSTAESNDIISAAVEAFEDADDTAPEENLLAELMGEAPLDDTPPAAAHAEVMGENSIDEQPRGVPEPGAEYRLVTRSDFDGLVCAVLLEELEMIDDILFVHPADMQEGRVEINDKDVTTNVPYVPGCHLAFDHHMSEVKRLGRKYDNHIIIPSAPSAARVVYEYYGGKEGFPNVGVDLMDAVDQGDSAQYNMDDVLNPQKWALLNFIMDSRTGLGRFRGFRIPNYELMMALIEYCRHYTIDEIMELPDVKERADFYKEHEEPFKEQINRCTTVHGNLAVLNLLEEEMLYAGNCFMVYALFPECNISMHCMWGRDRQNVVFACGKSIFDRASNTNIGELMLQYGGGGHHAAGTCQSDPLLAETVKQALIKRITEDG